MQPRIPRICSQLPDLAVYTETALLPRMISWLPICDITGAQSITTLVGAKNTRFLGESLSQEASDYRYGDPSAISAALGCSEATLK